MNIASEKTIGQLVAEDYRTAQIFKKHKINFYFRGSRSIKEVAEEHKLDAQILLNEIDAVQGVQIKENLNFTSWPLNLLVDYIEKKHHHYVKKNASIVKAYLENLSMTNGKTHLELLAVSEQFNNSVSEFSNYMKNEELFLFPIVREMIRAKKARVKLTKNNFGSLQNPISKMMKGHKIESERFDNIIQLTKNYTMLEDPRNSHVKRFAPLQEFVNDLHIHIHLENNILFPKLKTLEKQLKHEQ